MLVPEGTVILNVPLEAEVIEILVPFALIVAPERGPPF